MPYPALPDRVVPYNNDGSVVKIISAASGVIKTLSANERDELNDEDSVVISFAQEDDIYIVFFLADALEVSGLFAMGHRDDASITRLIGPTSIEGSNDTSNGIDGSWTPATAYTPNSDTLDFDSWRKSIEAVDMNSVEYVAYRVLFSHITNEIEDVVICHLYGIEAASPAAEADLPLLFVDPDNADARWPLPVNFGDVPAGTSVQDTFKIFNNHATDQANNVSLDVVDTDDIVRISENVGGPWVLQISGITIASQALSAEYHIKSEPAAPPTPLEPERASIEVSVGSWT